MPNALKVTTPTDLEIVIARDFDAPRSLVWDAMSRPEMLRRWMIGPPGWEMTVCEDEKRVGGTCRRAWSGPDGESMTMSGVYQEFAPPGRCVRTDRFDVGSGPGGMEQRMTLVLEDRGATTALTITLAYATREARDAALASGMDRGMAAGYDRLDEYLAGVAA